MTNVLSAIRPYSQWLRTSLLVGTIFVLTWGGVIWYWRVTDRVPDTGGLVLTLVVLPLALAGVTLIGKTLISSSSSTAISGEQPTATQATILEDRVAPIMTILATAVNVPQGMNPKALATSIAQNKVRPDVDKRLLDSSGLPVMSQRSSDSVVDESFQEEASAWLIQNETPGVGFSEEQWRALTLGTTATRDLVLQAVRNFLPTKDTAPSLRLIPLLPAEWTVDQRRLASRWLMHVAAQCGWPASRIVIDEAPIPSSASAVFNKLCKESMPAPIPALVIACASNIGQETVNQWDANHTLFTSTNPHGQVPGEGAAGLLLAGLDEAQPAGSAPVTRFYFEERLLDADSGHRTKCDSSALLRNLVETLAAQLAVPLSDLPMIVTDAGEQPARVLEVMQLANTLMPQVDGSRDIVCAGTACGTCGAVPLIAAISLACHFAAERQAPVLCIGNDDQTRRSVALVQPAELDVA
jgi:hypothetical protein